MANASTSLTGTNSSLFGGGAGSSNASSFSNAYTTTNQTDKTQSSAAAKYAYAPVVSATQGSTVNVTSSDYGATMAAKEVNLAAIDSANRSASGATTSARLALKEATDIIKTKAESDITKFTKPLIWLAVIGAVSFLGYQYYRRA